MRAQRRERTIIVAVMALMLYPALSSAAPTYTRPRAATRNITSQQSGVEWLVGRQKGWAEQSGRIVGAWTRNALLLNPLVRLNPLLQPTQLAKGAAMTGSAFEASSLRAFMAGLWPLGATRAVPASYFQGLAAGLSDQAP